MRGLWSSSGSNFCLAALAVRILFVVSVPTQFFVPIRVRIVVAQLSGLPSRDDI